MSSINDEFVMERCEEIISDDDKCVAASLETKKASKSFFELLSADQQKEYLKLESIFEKRNSMYMTTIYYKVYYDRQA
jgi:hypothetical protein